MKSLDKLFKEPVVQCVKQNTIVTSRVKATINTTNIDLLFEWLESLRDRRLNETTIKTYQQTITLIFCWNVMYNDNTCILDWDEYDLMSFYDWCILDNKLKPNRVRYMRQVLFSFINYIADTHIDACVNLLTVNEDLRGIERSLHKQEQR